MQLKAMYGEEGSVLQGTLGAFCNGLQIDVVVETDQDPDKVREMVKLAWNGCWTVQALLNEVQVGYTLQITEPDES